MNQEVVSRASHLFEHPTCHNGQSVRMYDFGMIMPALCGTVCVLCVNVKMCTIC